MKVALIIQRFGEEVKGGAESHCLKLAQGLKANHDVSILTTCAKNAETWENEYEPGLTQAFGLSVRRFFCPNRRFKVLFDNCYNFLVSYKLWRKSIPNLPLSDKRHVSCLLGLNDKNQILDEFSWSPESAPVATSANLLQKIVRRLSRIINRLLAYLPGYGRIIRKLSRVDRLVRECFSLELIQHRLVEGLLESFWMKQQGPVSPDLYKYLKKHRHKYDVFIFFSYNYATTFYGLPIVGKKAILIPTAHEEACLSFNLYKRLFKAPRWIFFNTLEEQILTHRVVKSSKQVPSEVLGLGIELEQETDFKQLSSNYGINKPYILYLGRVDVAKGCHDLFHNFEVFMKTYQEDLDLLLIGPRNMDVPHSERIRYLGYVSEQEKASLLKHARLLVMPSFYESLSIALLESWKAETPVLVNGDCQVLKGHCERSKGGLLYHDSESFCKSLTTLLNDESLAKDMGCKGRSYVEEHFNWQLILERVEAILREI